MNTLDTPIQKGPKRAREKTPDNSAQNCHDNSHTAKKTRPLPNASSSGVVHNK
jgi:hypothetical protein